MKPVAPVSAKLSALAESDFDSLSALARTIWMAHYTKIISVAQIEYMLAGRFTAENLRRYVNASDRWLEILKMDNKDIGYCSYALTKVPGEMKLEQLYLLPALHGRGLGGLMLQHVEDRSRSLGCRTLMLTVNKNNTDSIAIYRKAGFTVREEAVFDIGNGYVMDDYVMEKCLS